MRANRFIATGILALFLVTGSGNGFAAPSGAVAQGNISVFKGGQLAEKLTGQNPVEDEALLVCDGKCMIKAPGISLIGADGARLAIKNEQEQFNLLVNKGRVDFVITDSISKVAFYTPGGQYTVADIMFNASTNTPVRGYMQVADDSAIEIGVFEGRMVFSTAEGAKTVDSNNRLLLAMSEGVGKDAANNAPLETNINNDDDKTGLLALGGGVLGTWGISEIVSNNSGSDFSGVTVFQKPITATKGD